MFSFLVSVFLIYPSFSRVRKHKFTSKTFFGGIYHSVIPTSRECPKAQIMIFLEVATHFPKIQAPIFSIWFSTKNLLYKGIVLKHLWLFPCVRILIDW